MGGVYLKNQGQIINIGMTGQASFENTGVFRGRGGSGAYSFL